MKYPGGVKARDESNRQMFACFGGPRDGETVYALEPPVGYREYFGSLVVWWRLNVELMPFWSSRK